MAHYPRVLIGRRSFAAAAALWAMAVALSGCGSGVAVPVDAAATPVNAPAAVKSGPQLGYVWSDTARTLRPVLGIPGSSQLGQSVVAAGLYAGGAASAASNLAVMVEGDGALDVIALPAGAPVRVVSAGAVGAVLRLGPSGVTAVAFVPGSTTATLVTGLGRTPVAAAVSFGGAIQEAAVSDDGAVAGAIEQEGGFAVRVMGAGGVANGAGSVGSVGGMTFVGATDDLVVADATANTITVVRNSTTAPAATLLPSGGMLHGPVGVGVSRDGRWAVVANGGDAGIARLDLSGQSAPQRFVCACQPTMVAQLAGRGVFRVTGTEAGAAWMLDASGTTPRVLFIPASSDATGAGTQKAGTN